MPAPARPALASRHSKRDNPMCMCMVLKQTWERERGGNLQRTVLRAIFFPMSILASLGLAVLLAAVLTAVLRAPPAVDDVLAAQMPFVGHFDLSTGVRVPTPYRASDGRGFNVGGYLPAEKAQALMDAAAVSDHLQLLLTADGKAQAVFWFMDYQETGIGPYGEVVVTLLTTWKGVADAPKAVDCASTNAFCVFGSGQMAAQPHVRHWAYRLWLDQETAVAYGREILGTDKFLRTDMKLTETSADVPGVLSFSAAPMTVLGTVASLPAFASAVGGFRRLFAMLSAPLVDSFLVSTPGIAKFNPTMPPEMRGVFVNGDSAMRAWDEAAGDSLVVAADAEAALATFEPSALLLFPKVHFGLANPHNSEG